VGGRRNSRAWTASLVTARGTSRVGVEWDSSTAGALDNARHHLGRRHEQLAARFGIADIALADEPMTTLRHQVRRTLGETTVHMAERVHRLAYGI